MADQAAVLWLDNDPANIEPLVGMLRGKGIDVVVCKTVSTAAHQVASRAFDILILDVMIPVTQAELPEYPFEETDDTMTTGLLFYKRMKHRLDAARTRVLVMTVRIDKAIASAFFEAGLPKQNFATKMELRDAKRFDARIGQLLTAEPEAS